MIMEITMTTVITPAIKIAMPQQQIPTVYNHVDNKINSITLLTFIS